MDYYGIIDKNSSGSKNNTRSKIFNYSSFVNFLKFTVISSVFPQSTKSKLESKESTNKSPLNNNFQQLYSSFEKKKSSFIDSPKRMFLDFLEEKNGLSPSAKNQRNKISESYYTTARIKGNKEAIHKLRQASTSYHTGRVKSIKKSSKFNKIVSKNERIQANSVVNKGQRMNPIRITKEMLNYLNFKREKERRTSKSKRSKERTETHTQIDKGFKLRYSNMFSDKPSSTLKKYKFSSAKEIASDNAYIQNNHSANCNRPVWIAENGQISIKNIEKLDIL